MQKGKTVKSKKETKTKNGKITREIGKGRRGKRGKKGNGEMKKKGEKEKGK